MASRQPIEKRALITTPSDTEIRIERMFDAPRDLVFRAYSDPNLLVRWLGPRRFKMTVEQMDVRPGGRWRFLHTANDGTEYRFHGEYREIVPSERIVQTWVFEGVPDAESFQTARFEEHAGRTKVIATVQYRSKGHRDGELQSGMESGMNEGYERLDELLQTLR